MKYCRSNLAHLGSTIISLILAMTLRQKSRSLINLPRASIANSRLHHLAKKVRIQMFLQTSLHHGSSGMALFNISSCSIPVVATRDTSLFLSSIDLCYECEEYPVLLISCRRC